MSSSPAGTTRQTFDPPLRQNFDVAGITNKIGAPYWARADAAEEERRAERAELAASPEADSPEVAAVLEDAPRDPKRQLAALLAEVSEGPRAAWLRGDHDARRLRNAYQNRRPEIGPRAPGAGGALKTKWVAGSKYQLDTRTGELAAHAAHVPNSTRACLAGALWLAHHDKPTENLTLTQMGCNSWRCPNCGPRVNRRDFLRIRKALDKLPDGSVFVTLTFDRRDWTGPYEAAQGAARGWQKFRQAIQYELGTQFEVMADKHGRVKLPYLMVFEQHVNPDASGYWLHAHLIISSPLLADWLKRAGTEEEYNPGKIEFETRSKLTQFGGKLWAMAHRAGFGRVDFKPLAGRQGMAEYLTKLSYMAGEITGSRKKSQYPTHAPPGFRRIRASQGFMPALKPRLEGVEKKVAEVMVAPRELLTWLLDSAGGRLKRNAQALAQSVRDALGSVGGAGRDLGENHARGALLPPPRPPGGAQVAVVECPF